jgi:predicted transcriptional regulator of viral defense system
MRFDDFHKHVQGLAVFGDEVCSAMGEARASTRLQLSRWTKAGKLIRLKRGLYTLPPDSASTPCSRRWLANTLYSPSYLSLAYVLSWFDLIPERVPTYTSISTLKTTTLHNALGRFTYQRMKPEVFFGFSEHVDEYGKRVLMATPEKALLDFIYLSRDWEPTADFLEHHMRLQQLAQLRKSYLQMYTRRFQSHKMTQAVQMLLKYMRHT